MNSKKEVPDIIYDNMKVEVDIPLFNNLLSVFDELKYNQKTIAKKIEFKISTLSDILRKRKDGKVKQSIRQFCYQAFIYIIKYHKDKFFFNLKEKSFEKVDKQQKPQFLNGTYYGYFKKVGYRNEKISHFILIVENEVTLTVWSSENTSKGKLEDNEGIYFATLRSLEHNNASFLIGTKISDPKRKIFIGTWSTRDNDLCSALCLAKYIEDSPFTSLDVIEKNKREILQEVILKTPDDLYDFFREQEHKFIIKSN
jgi:hypothetical protein